MKLDDKTGAFIEAEFRALHEAPELSFEEFATTARLKAVLSERNVKILDLPLKTGLVAEVGRGEPLIALRADIDALPVTEETDLPYRSKVPGKMHACGHDFHTAAVLGAALALGKAQLSGRVRLVFQPAEEAAGGAKHILDTGALDDAAFVLGLHTSPLLPVGTVGLRAGAVTAAVDKFAIRFRGIGTHAAHPEGGRDPIVAAAGFISAAQTIVSRNLNPMGANLVSITRINAGNTWNVIPEEAFLEGTARSLSPDERAAIKARMHELAEGIAAAYGVTAAVEWYDGPPPTDNDAAWTDFAAGVAKSQGLAVKPSEVSLIGEDFALYQEKTPGVFIHVGTGLGESLHSPRFVADPAALVPAADFMAALAEAALGKLAGEATA